MATRDIPAELDLKRLDMRGFATSGAIWVPGQTPWGMA